MAHLFRLLEARHLVFTQETTKELGDHDFGQLLASGFLVPHDFEMIANANEMDGDTSVSVVRSGDGGQLGYHSPHQGWRTVKKYALQRFAPSIEHIFRCLLDKNLSIPPAGFRELVPGLFWELGSVSLLPTGRTTVLYGRRLGDMASRQRIVEALKRRPSTSLRLLLTTTLHECLPEVLLDLISLVPIADVISIDESDRIDIEILRARFRGVPTVGITSPLHLSPDGKTLTLAGKGTVTFRGKINAKIIRLLHDATMNGAGISLEHLLTRSGASGHSLDQVFGKRWAEIKPFLKNDGGLWRFDI